MSSSSLSCLPSSSSQIQQNLFQKTSSLKATSLAKRQATVFKKASQLSILCGIEVCVIYYGSDGELETWPKDREMVKDMARRYIQLSDLKRRKGQDDLDQFLKKINKEESKKNNKKKKKKKVEVGSSCKYPDWDPRFDNCSVEQLTELIQSLELTQTNLQHRLRGVVESQRQRNLHYNNMAGQEQMITAMNHLQQHSNQGSMDLYNHGIGTLPQLQVSASAFNQSQSLAPIPSSLTMCQNPNMESYSSLLGVQKTGMNHLQKHSNQGSLDLYDHGMGTLPKLQVSASDFNQSESLAPIPSSLTIHQNPNMESYSSLLGVQETGMNHLQKHSNQGSMDQYNHGMGTLPQLQVSVSAFNQSQSLAPVPNPLMRHQNPNMESYSSLLGVQENGLNEVMSPNMLPYNSINTNCGNVFSNQFLQNCYNNVEDYHSGFLGLQGTGINNMNAKDYSGSLWTQGTRINGLQNMNMYGYNNPNGFSQQLVQFPVQRTPPVFQYMDRSNTTFLGDLVSGNVS